ncbi:MAG: SDR family NAD(P)-dependent oxidoreductase [Myxococcota bacterium]|nr:SDR family NAD(P)-dependent oxidoreductase [Myxococcota bacterium]
MSPEPRTIWITGASSGIGAATARAFGAEGHRVALGARREERLEEVAKQVEGAGGRAFAHPLDVRDPASIDRFARAAEAALGPPDVLVNNAGQNLSSLLHEASPEALRADVETNLLSALWMTRAVLPGMLERRAGDVVFIGSDTAQRPRPYMAAYSAAKAGIEALAKVVEMETEGTGVRSILMRVGPTGSEFGNQMPKEQIHDILASWKYWGVFRNMHWMPAESVARAVVRTVAIPVEESYPAVVEVQPGGRKKEPRD